MLEVFLLTLDKVAMLLIFIATGYLLRRHSSLPENTGRVLSLLCTLIFAPAYSLSTLSQNLTRDVFAQKLPLIAWGAVFVLAAIGLAYLLSLPFGGDRIQRNSLVYAFAIPNYGYFGYPVIEGVFGQAVLADAMIFMIPLNLATNSFGYSLFFDEKRVSVKSVLLTPMTIGIILGAALGISGIPLPGAVSSAFSGAGSCMSPCSMLLAGFLLGKFPLKDLLTGWRPYVYSAVRLIVVPAIFAAVLMLCGITGQYRMLPLLTAGIPLGLNLVVFPESRGFEKQAGDNAKLCFVSYLLALAVLPVTFALLSRIPG